MIWMMCLMKLITIIKIEIKKGLIVFDDMIADIEYNKKFKRIIKELFYRARKKTYQLYLLLNRI